MTDREQTARKERVLQFIRQHDLASSPLVVAVSGGADSVCLLHILFKLRDELGITLHVAHLDHQLRGAESEDDARHVADLASNLGIPASIEKRDVAAYQASQGLSLEEAAREVRYAFLAEVAERVGAGRVALGHTLDDHVETVLMHIIRGTGTRGLTGLKPRVTLRFSGKSLTIVRPLLMLSRAETGSYCRDYGLVPRLDATNRSLSMLRNRIRLELLPQLKQYNPQIIEALLRLAEIAGDDISFMDAECARVWNEVAQEQDRAVFLDKKGFLALPSAIQRNLLRTCAEKLLGDIKDVEARHIEEITEALAKPAGKRISLPRGLTFVIEYERYVLTADETALSPFPSLEGEFPLTIPGETVLPGWTVEAAIEKPQTVKSQDAYRAYLDLGRTGDRLVVRDWRAGDRFQPQGMSRTKKVGEFMIDARIPRDWRKQVPIVCSPEQVVWVVGWRIDDRVKVTENTKRVLCLRFERAE